MGAHKKKMFRVLFRVLNPSLELSLFFNTSQQQREKVDDALANCFGERGAFSSPSSSSSFSSSSFRALFLFLFFFLRDYGPVLVRLGIFL